MATYLVWLRGLAAFLAILVLALLAWAAQDAMAAWFVAAVGFCWMWLRQLYRLSRLHRWTLDLSQPPPDSVGEWDDLTLRLYRQQRAKDRELAESRERMQSWVAASQALPDGVVVMDDEFHIDWCNREARRNLGLRLPADRGQNLLNLVRDPDFVRYARQDDWPEPRTVPAPGRSGRVLLVQFIRYGRGQRLLVARDVTQVERAEVMRRDFVANVSHELRTPLTVLMGFLETLREAPPGALAEQQREHYFDLMSEQSRRMQGLVGDLLTLSTLESSPAHDRPGPAAMPALIEAARQQVEALSGGSHTFFWAVDEALDVRGTGSELASAVTNLLTNAVRYTPAGGCIQVAWRATAEGGAIYSVTDSGIGIDPAHLPRLTERFYRVDRSRSRASGGTGLGLAICKHVALRHDAELQIESQLGQGSTFSLAFPPERVVPRLAS